jgi:hypothetical protein
MVPMPYSQRVRETILQRSVGGTLPEAFEEWFFTNETIDHEIADQQCELCGKSELRYHFAIANRYTHHRLWVGSHCILQFEIAVYEDGEQLDPADARRHLTKLRQRMQLDFCIKALTKLSQSENNPILTGALDYYKRKKKLTPKFAFVVFWKLQDHGIEHQPSFFQIELKRQKHQDDLRIMETDRVHRFWHALSPSQRKKAQELGHVPPLEASSLAPAAMPAMASFPPLPRRIPARPLPKSAPESPPEQQQPIDPPIPPK